MRTVDYDDKDSANTETHIATDEAMEKKFGDLQHAYEEGFASASGVRAGTAETDGSVKHPETSDEAARANRVRNPNDDENAGLADN
jgi:hypothetical protein